MDDKLSFLQNKKFLFLGGKGGVGKTTMAASLGMLAASSGIKTLTVSTDPAHSLADVYGQPLGTKIATGIHKTNKLYGQEINAEETMDDVGYLLQQQNMGMINQLFSENDNMADYSPPGMDEIVALMKLVELIENQTEYDLVIFDTAPTGHTLNLLELPDVVDSWAYKILSLQKKMKGLMRGIKGLFGSSEDPMEDPMDNIERLREKIAVGKETLMNENITEFIPVTIPTKLSFWETDRLLKVLNQNNIHANHIIINQINPQVKGCKFCEKRYEAQRKILDKMEHLFSNYYLFKAYLQADEPQGIEEIDKFARKVFMD